MSVEIRRADERFRTTSEWLDSRHSFSFGPHYDPANVGFGFLLAHNDETVAPGTGFDTHPHQDLEIVTWVLRGALAHRDSEGHSGVVYPGLAQRMSAGSGIRHSEWNDGGEPVHYVQMWVRPEQFDLEPSYQQAAVDLVVRRAGADRLRAAEAREQHRDPHQPAVRGHVGGPAGSAAIRWPCRQRRTSISSLPKAP